MESNNEVRQSALMVWELLTDGPRLFLRRKQVLTTRARLIDTNVSHRWGDNVRSKLPFETDFRRYHTVLRPFANIQPAFREGNCDDSSPKNLKIMRMKLNPRDDVAINIDPAKAAIELNRLRSLQSQAKGLSDHPQDRPLPPNQEPSNRRASGAVLDRRRSNASPQMQRQLYPEVGFISAARGLLLLASPRNFLTLFLRCRQTPREIVSLLHFPLVKKT